MSKGNIMARFITVVLMAAALAACQAPGLLSGEARSERDRQTVVGLMRDSSAAASETLAREGGYTEQETLRLTLPQEMSGMADALRRHGFGARLDEMERLMNLAAERAAGEAAEVFAAVIADTPIHDPRAILREGNAAATRYLWENARDDLALRYQPVIREQLGSLGFYEVHRLVLDLHQSLPVDRDRGMNLEQYVLRQALVGLARRMADEERRLREEGI